jgi:hypothetical protein
MIAWLLDLQLPMQIVPITTNVMSSNPAQTNCTQYNIDVIKFVSDLREIGGSCQGILVSSSNKTDSLNRIRIMVFNATFNNISVIS